MSKLTFCYILDRRIFRTNLRRGVVSRFTRLRTSMNDLGAGLIGVAVPLGLIWLKLGVAFTRMARRKGTNTKLALIGAFPLWALPFGLWLIMRSESPTPQRRVRPTT